MKFIELGLSEYEAKAYLALIKDNPATAYEVARTSGIPTSKIYEVLARMEEKKIVLATEGEGKKRFIPLSPDEFIESRKYKLEKILDSLHEDLSRIRTEKDVSYIWNVHDYVSLLEKAERIILKAKKHILISGWKDDLAALEDILLQKETQNVKISIVHFGPVEINAGRLFQHPIEDTIYNEKGGRGLVIVVDSLEALMGTVFGDNSVEGAWSANRGFVTLAEDYIKHDIYIMKIVERFDKQLIERFGDNYYKLRDIFNNEELS